MKRIAIASDDGQTIAAHTGRCAGFVVFEVNDGVAQRSAVRPNTFTVHARGECQDTGGHDVAHVHHSHSALVDAISDCCALVTCGLGPRLVADLTERGIDAYVTNVTSVQQAAQDFASGRLVRVAGTGCTRHAH